MRFEKLNENKIKITLNYQDLIEKNIDLHSFMSSSIESQDLFFDMLDEAEKEIGFSTKNYKIRIEALAMSDGDFVLTVTRSLPDKEKNITKRKIQIKRKKNDFKSNSILYSFNNFDDFFSFLDFLNNNNFSITNIAKSILLYEYKSTYYLIFSDINLEYTKLKQLFSAITEFATYISSSDLFVRKLNESGKIIIKNNALKIGTEYFVKK
jgi:adapter protein MecA 1/2